MRIYMQMPAADSGPLRFYHLMIQEDLLEGWTLVREWGIQGSSGRVRREHHASLESAMNALMRSRDTQIDRGYRVVFMQGQYQSGSS